MANCDNHASEAAQWVTWAIQMMSTNTAEVDDRVTESLQRWVNHINDIARQCLFGLATERGFVKVASLVSCCDEQTRKRKHRSDTFVVDVAKGNRYAHCLHSV